MKRINFRNPGKLAMERILLWSLRLVIEELIMRIRSFEDSMFSGKYANMNRKELELVAMAFIRDQLDNLNGYRLGEYLCSIRYNANPQRDLEEIKKEVFLCDVDEHWDDEGA